MKTNRAVVVALALVAAMGFASIASASASHPKKSSPPFEETPGWAKIDLRLRQAWQDATAPGGEKDRALECLVKVGAKPTDADKAALSGAGFNYRIFAGKIVTGSLKAQALPEVANLSFVEAMELAVPMSIKKKKDQPK